MKKNFLYLLIFLLCSMSFLTSAYAGPNEHAGIVFDLDATTYGNQNVTNIPSQAEGTYLRVDIYCTKVHNLDTYEFEVIYDPEVLDYIACSATNPITFEENILTSEGGTAIGWMVDTSTPGVLSIAYTLADTDTLQAPDGEGLVADIVFQALEATHGTLTFDFVQFIDSYGVKDAIKNKGVALLSNYGNVTGKVRNANDEPIEDALITATRQDKFEYNAYTNSGGYYVIDSLIPGNYTFVCNAADQGYNIAYEYNIEIIADNTSQVDFTLTSPTMKVHPLGIFPVVDNMGDSTTIDITLSNMGTGPLDWYRTIVASPLEIEFPTPPAVITFDHSKPSLGLATEKVNSDHSGEPVVSLMRGSTGWAFDAQPGQYFYSFNTDTPEAAQIIKNSPGWVAFAGDFDSGFGDDAIYYIIKYPDNVFARVDKETGIATDIGPIIGSGGDYLWTGLSCDKSTGIMYATEADGNSSNLYTIDLSTGTPTLIGATGIPAVIDIAVDGEGILWGHDIIGDNIYIIDKTTGVGTLKGSTGFDANCAQGMSWDPVTDQVYLTAYSTFGEFRVLDRNTGYCAYVGPLPDNDEVCALGFIGGIWMRVEPTSGTIEPGSDEIVHTTVYWLEEFLPGQSKYADIVFTSDPDCGEQTVNVTAIFGPATSGSISGTVILEDNPYSTGNVEDVLITATNQISPSMYYTTNPSSTGEYLLPDIYPGTYDVTAYLENYEDTTIVDVVVLDNQSTTNIDFEMNCLLGALSGTVKDGYGVPIKGAYVTAIGNLLPSEPYSVTTNEAGYYEINPIISQFYNFTCEAEGFITFTSAFTILPGETHVENVTMGSPEIDVTPDSVIIILDPNSQGTKSLTVSNAGNAPLNWRSFIVVDDNTCSNMPTANEIEPHKPVYSKNEFASLSELAASIGITSSPQRDFGDIVEQWPTPDNWPMDIVWDPDEDIIWHTSENTPGNCLYKIDIETHNIIDSYPAPNPFGMQAALLNGICLVDDYLYLTDFNGDLEVVDDFIMQVDKNDLSVIDTWEVDPAIDGISGITYRDPYFYIVSGITSLIYEVDLHPGGTFDVISTIASPVGATLAGIDYLPYTSPPQFWLTSRLRNLIIKADENFNVINTAGGPTGSMSGLTWPGEGENFWLVGFLSRMMYIVDGDINASTISWMKVEPTSGTVATGSDSLVTLLFDTTDLLPGTVLNANIHFFSTPNVGNPIVPVTLKVGTPAYGTFEGYVKKASDSTPVEGVVVTATSVEDVEYQDTTNSEGYYVIPKIQEKTYNVSCFAADYNIPAIQTTTIVGNETNTVNFSLTQPSMDITTTSISRTVSPDEPLAVDIHVVNNGDGELAWDASILTFDRGEETILGAKNGKDNGSDGFTAEKNSKGDIILHYDGPNNNDGFGLPSGGIFTAAARFTPKELGDYYGKYQLSMVEIFIYSMPISATLKVWEGGYVGDPGTEIYSEDITAQIAQNSWAKIILSVPIDLIPDNEYWVGYEVTHYAGGHPAGYDAGPAVDKKGDWVYNVVPGPWDEIQNLGHDVNWNIRAVLSLPWIALEDNSGIVEASGDSTVTVYFNTIDHAVGDTLHATIDFVSTPDVGIVSIPVTIMVGDVGVPGEPEHYETRLLGNFPNPFSASTMIRFSLKEDSHVKLSIYNIRGQLVERLVDQDMMAGSGYQIEWNQADRNVANGIYFYKLETGNKTFLKKMILMK